MENKQWFENLTNRKNMIKLPENQSLSVEQKRLAFESWLAEHSPEKHFVSVHGVCQNCPYRQ